MGSFMIRGQVYGTPTYGVGVTLVERAAYAAVNPLASITRFFNYLLQGFRVNKLPLSSGSFLLSAG